MERAGAPGQEPMEDSLEIMGPSEVPVRRPPENLRPESRLSPEIPAMSKNLRPESRHVPCPEAFYL